MSGTVHAPLAKASFYEALHLQCVQRLLQAVRRRPWPRVPMLGAVLLVALTGCGTAARAVRLDTGMGEPILFVPHAGGVEPVALGKGEFQAAVAEHSRDVQPSPQPRAAAHRLLGSPRQDGAYSNVRRHLGLISARTDEGTHDEASPPPPGAWKQQVDVALTRAYQERCARKSLPLDCLNLLEHGPTLDEEGKRALALNIALDLAWNEMEGALRDMTNPQAIQATILAAMTVYLGLWLLPEPVSKGVAAGLTVCLFAYLGVDTVWNLIAGWRRLALEVEVASTFDDVEAAGRRYGKLLGRNAARILIMVATAAIGQTAGLATKLFRLPGSAQAVRLAAAGAGVRLTAVSQVEAVAVSTAGATIALAPGAVAMTARGTGSAPPAPVDPDGDWHHIASDKFSASSNNGGPWTPKYQDIFDRAGMSLNDPANKVRVKGHKGPHPQEYHEEVFRRLDDATVSCNSIELCWNALTKELQQLARLISTPGTRLNKLVTRAE